MACAEFAIGVGLALGLFTPLACLASLLLLFTYVMSGTASVCRFYALFAIVILATSRPGERRVGLALMASSQGVASVIASLNTWITARSTPRATTRHSQ
ncbi:MAG: hypothetical protein WA614_00715 [Acidimicrobiales bacterium]